MKRKQDHTLEIETNQPLDKKKLLPRAIAFFFFVALAITCITVGVTSLGRRETGLQTIEATLDKDVPRFQVGVSFRHWFSGSSGDIRRGVNELSELYTGALKDAFRLLDAENVYDGWANVATLNRNLGREVVVPKALYEALRQADAFTRREQGYSLFAGALYAEWESLRYQLEPAETDPLADPAEAARLERLAAATAELSNFSLEFLDDAACKVRFTVDPRYLDLLEELELSEAPILDLNVLRDAFKLQLVADRLEEKGYDRGFLTTDSGLTLALSAYRDGGDYAVFGLAGDTVVLAADCPVTPGSTAAWLRAFGVEDEPGYYALERDGETFLRHPWLPADGRCPEVLLSVLAVGQGKSLPETCYAAFTLFTAGTPEEAKAAAVSLTDCAAAILLCEEPKTVYVTDETFRPSAENGFGTERLR